MEKFCPPDFVKNPVYFVASRMPQKEEVSIPNDAAYPQCAAKMKVRGLGYVPMKPSSLPDHASSSRLKLCVCWYEE